MTASIRLTDPGNDNRLIAICDIFSEDLPYRGNKYGTLDDIYTVEVEGPLTTRFVPELDSELQIQHRLKEVPFILAHLVEISFITVADRDRLQLELSGLDYMRDILLDHEQAKLPDPRFTQLLLFKTVEETYVLHDLQEVLFGQISFDNLTGAISPDGGFVNKDTAEAA